MLESERRRLDRELDEPRPVHAQASTPEAERQRRRLERVHRALADGVEDARRPLSADLAERVTRAVRAEPRRAPRRGPTVLGIAGLAAAALALVVLAPWRSIGPAATTPTPGETAASPATPPGAGSGDATLASALPGWARSPSAALRSRVEDPLLAEFDHLSEDTTRAARSIARRLPVRLRFLFEER